MAARRMVSLEVATLLRPRRIVSGQVNGSYAAPAPSRLADIMAGRKSKAMQFGEQMAVIAASRTKVAWLEAQLSEGRARPIRAGLLGRTSI